MSETTAPAPADVLAALEVVHAALDSVSMLDPEGRQTGWASVEGLEGGDLERVVSSVARLEGRVQGL